MEYDARRKRPNHFQELRHTQVCDFVLVNLRIIEFSAAQRQQSAHIQLHDSTCANGLILPFACGAMLNSACQGWEWEVLPISLQIHYFLEKNELDKETMLTSELGIFTQRKL
jgi:hypothetical protein